VGLVTQRYDVACAGATFDESILLNITGIGSGNVGKLLALYADGQVVAQPLYVSDLPIDAIEDPNAPVGKGRPKAHKEDTMAEDVHRIELRARTVEELRSFLDGATDLDLGCRPAVRRQPSGELIVEVYATMPQVDRLRASRSAPGVTVSIVENATQTGRARQAEVGSRNRFSGQQPPSGLGIKE
jgi:hypothetical protein